MNITVKDFISNYSCVGDDAMPVDFFVKMIGNPRPDGTSNVLSGRFDEMPYMYNDAKVMGWRIKPSNKTTKYGQSYIEMHIVASDS